MTLSSHCAIGGAIGAAIGQPLIIIPVALASHFLLDSFPHTDLAHLQKANPDGTLSDKLPWWVYLIVAIDLMLVATILIWATINCPQRANSISIGGVAGMFFDFQYIPWFGPWMSGQWWYKPIHWLHEPWHLHFPLSHAQRWYGIHTQLIALAAGIFWLMKFFPT